MLKERQNLITCAWMVGHRVGSRNATLWGTWKFQDVTYLNKQSSKSFTELLWDARVNWLDVWQLHNKLWDCVAHPILCHLHSWGVLQSRDKLLGYFSSSSQRGCTIFCDTIWYLPPTQQGFRASYNSNLVNFHPNFSLVFFSDDASWCLLCAKAQGSTTYYAMPFMKNWCLSATKIEA